MKYYCTLFLVLSISLASLGQTEKAQEDIVEIFEEYTELHRETVYVHTNKTTYIKGEQLGFAAYTFEKDSKKLSKETRNLYVTLSGKNGTPLKQKLFKVENGTAHGDFVIDSLFTSGSYILKAYTNWMKNFDEQNYFVQTIDVIDPELEQTFQRNQITETRLDTQFLPEGGHLVSDVENTIGVVIKDSLGFGIPDVEGAIFDENDGLLVPFKVNGLGLGAFSFIPEYGKTYMAKMDLNGKEHSFPLPMAEEFGFSMHLRTKKDSVHLLLKANASSLPQLKLNNYYLLVHNGSNTETMALPKFSTPEIGYALSHDILFSGMNILTVFDATNNPISERLYFNYKGISFHGTSANASRTKADSINIDLAFKKLKLDSISAISVSVLPETSISNNPHYTIASHTLLRPYVKGNIENGGSYFHEINEKSKKQLDLLLLTQGWSSYDWDTVFNEPPDYVFDYEIGMGYTLERSSTQESNIIRYPWQGGKLEMLTLKEGQTKLEHNGLFPFNNDSIRIGEMGKRKRIIKPDFRLSFYPSKVPLLEHEYKSLGNPLSKTFKNKEIIPQEPLQKGVRELTEVKVTAQKKQTKLELLQMRTFGTVEKIDVAIKQRHQTFINYIRQRGFSAYQDASGNLILKNLAYGLGTTPIVYLNGVAINNPGAVVKDSSAPKGSSNLNILLDLQLSDLEFVEINKSGMGERLGAAGVIRIYAGPGDFYEKDKSVAYTAYAPPLVFSRPRRFYLPKYSSFNTTFYKFFGVLGWFPNLKPNRDGKLGFKVPYTGLKQIRLYIEGTTQKGGFITDIVELSLD